MLLDLRSLWETRPTDNTKIFRAPLVSVRSRLAARQSWDVPNLLLSTLGLADQLPFQSTDFLPRQPIRTRTDWATTSRLPEIPASMPFTGMELGKPSAQNDRRDRNLFGAPILDPVLSPFVSVDWLPRARATGRASQESANLLTGTLFTPDAMPFSATEWPTRAAAQSRLVHDAPNLAISTLFPVEASPFVSVDWLTRQTRSRQDFMPPNMIGFMTYDYGTPFTMHEWSGKTRAQDRKSADVPNLADLLTAAIQNPFVATEWTAKPRMQSRQDSGLPNMLDLLTATIQAPFFLTEWPARTRAHNRQEFAPQSMLDLLTATIQRPFFLTDWQTKPRVRGRAEAATPNMLSLLSAVVPGSTLYDIVIRGGNPSGVDDYYEQWFA